MPTVSVESQVSEAVYLGAIIVLSALLARPVYSVYAASQQRSAQAVDSGMAAMLNSMSPGTTAVASLESYPGVPVSVALYGSTVVASFGAASASTHVRWELPRLTLVAGEAYNFTLSGGEVLVAPSRAG